MRLMPIRDAFRRRVNECFAPPFLFLLGGKDVVDLQKSENRGCTVPDDPKHPRPTIHWD